MELATLLIQLLYAGWLGLLDYLAAHVLLCLLPALFIAGYLSLIPRENITRYLGARSPKWISYSASAIGGFVLAVCSCTVLPLFAGIWKRGAGLGPAVTFLFVAPAVNVVAISYTGTMLGADIAFARMILAVSFGIGIGLIIAYVFRKQDATPRDNAMFDQQSAMRPALWAMLGLLFSVLIVGTLQIDLLTGTLASIYVPFALPSGLQTNLDTLHLTAQGAVLILMLAITMPVAWKGLNNVQNGLNCWTCAALSMIAFTLIIAAPTMSMNTTSLTINVTGRVVAETILLCLITYIGQRHLSREEVADWLCETWRFVKQIFPILLLGVFIAGMARAIIPADWIRALAGQNSIWANALAVLFGVFMYFPTLVEVPVARMFLELGMHKGPLLAYLLADPELSLQNILVTSKIMGRQKTAVYVSLVALFSTTAGLVFGQLIS